MYAINVSLPITSDIAHEVNSRHYSQFNARVVQKPAAMVASRLRRDRKRTSVVVIVGRQHGRAARQTT